MKQKDIFEPSGDSSSVNQNNLELEQFFDINPNLLCIMNTEGTLLRLNKVWESTLGYSKEDILGKNINVFLSADNVDTAFLTNIDNMADLKETAEFIRSLRCADGSIKSFAWTIQVFNNLLYVAGHEVTKRLEMESIANKQKEQYELILKKSQENEVYLKTILDTVQDGFAVIRNKKIMDANDVFLNMTGYSKEELASLQFEELIAEESMPDYLEKRKILYNEGYLFTEIKSKKKNGDTLDVEVAATALSGEPFLTVLFIRDITERKTVRKKLLDFHELLRYVIEHNLLAISVHDKNSNYMYVSQPYIEMFGLQNQEIIGKNLYDVQYGMPPAYREIHQRVLKGEIIRRESTNSVFKNGRYVRWECRPWYEQDGTIGGYVLYIEDITERVLMEKLLVNEKEQFKTTLLSVGDGVISTDDTGKITVMNPLAEKLTCWSFNEAVGRPLCDVFKIINEHTKIPYVCSILKVMEEGEVVELSNKLLITKKGKEVPVDISMAPIKHSDGKVTGVVIVLRDVTEKRAEQRQIEFLSYNDVLTGLYNRRYIEDTMKRIDMPENLPLAVFSIDVNGLKLTNDAFGHEMGDQLLKTVAGILKMVCGSEHIIGRMGGDEFCILMKRTDDELAANFKEKILKEISNLKLYPVVVSLAIGYANKYAINEEIKLVQTLADNRMYQDKIKYGKIMRNQTIQMALQNLNLNYEHEQVHAERVSDYCESIAKAMNFSEKEIKDIKTVGIIHDIGKIMVPPQVINKPDKLTDEELYLVRRHPEIGYQMLKMVEDYAHLAENILYHHERWDGNGYPVGIKGEKIPLISRIIAVADAYEAMTGTRPYKKTRSKEEAVEELIKNAGTQFDPEIVKIFVEKVL